MIGRTISHYKILEKLGEGGMGVVYKAHDTNLDRLVALKFLPQQITRQIDVGQAVSEEDKASFLQEARAISALSHPNIATIFDIDEVDGPPPTLALWRVNRSSLSWSTYPAGHSSLRE